MTSTSSMRSSGRSVSDSGSTWSSGASGSMHPRVALHHVASGDESVAAFVDRCRAAGAAHMTIGTPQLMQAGGVERLQAQLAGGGPRVECLVHPFALTPNLEKDEEATGRLIEAIVAASELGAASIYMLTGG